MSKIEIARAAALAWIGRNGVNSERFTYEQISAYADSIAYALVAGEGSRYATVNGMRFVSGNHYNYVVTI